MKKCVTILLAMMMLISTLPLTALAEGTAGTYTGTGMGYGGEIVVEVDVTADGIGAIRVISHNETAGIGSVAAERLPSMMLAAQSPYVDVVSGATITSVAIQDAVADAMAKSGMEVSLPPAPEDLYGPNGPWNSWTEEQKTAAESWTEYQWNTYWDQYNTAANALSDQYWDDRYTWREEHYPAQPEDDYLYEAKKEMGMPYPGGTNISRNGEYLDFGGIAPIGSVYDAQIPFRAFLEGMGGKVAYQDGKFIATMPDGMSIMAEPNSTLLSYTVGDKINNVEMYGTPVVENRVTYVNAEALAEALGLGVYYDYYYDVLELTDWVAFQAEVNGRFSHYNALMAAAIRAVDMEKNYATKGAATLSATLYGDKKHSTATVGANVTGLTGPESIYTKTSCSVNLGDFEKPLASLLGTETSSQMTEYLAQMNSAQQEYILNKTTGEGYTKGGLPALDKSLALPTNVWLHAESTQVAPNLLDTLAENPSLGALLTGYYDSAFGNIVGGNSGNPYKSLMRSVDMMALLLGDEALTATTSGSTTTYTADVTLEKLVNGMNALYPELGPTSLEEIKATDSDFHWSFTAKSQNEKLISINMSFTGRLGVGFPLSVEMKLSGSPLDMKGSFALRGDYVGKLEGTITSTATVTTKTVPVMPPEGEPVKELSEAIEELWNMEAILPQVSAIAEKLLARVP